MKKLFGSLRFKIVAFNLAAFTLVLGVLSVFIFATYETYLRNDFDNRLRDRAESMAETIAIASDALEPPVPQISPYRFPGYYFQIRAEDGRLLEKSNNLGEEEIPFFDASKRAKTEGVPVFETIRGESARRLAGTEELRVLTIYHSGDATAPYYLQIAVSLDSVDHSISELVRTLLAAFLIGLSAAGIASFLLAWRSLAPIVQIAKQARQLTAARLDQRIAEPDSNDEVAYLVRVINGMLNRLQQAFAAQERFIADVSHELRTPLSILLGEAQVLSQQNRPREEYDRFIGSVQEEMRRLAQVVNSLLTLARAHAGFPLPAAAALPVNDFVVDAVQRCEAIAKQRSVRLVPALAMPEVEESAEPTVEGDAELLSTMLSNLIRNAVRYSPAGGTVEIRVQSDEGKSQVVVADRGPGIAPEHLGNLFNRFYHVPKNGATGSGLGLAIAKAVVDLHQGSIEVRNRAGGGSEFIVTLPQAAAEAAGT